MDDDERRRRRLQTDTGHDIRRLAKNHVELFYDYRESKAIMKIAIRPITQPQNYSQSGTVMASQPSHYIRPPDTRLSGGIDKPTVFVRRHCRSRQQTDRRLSFPSERDLQTGDTNT